MTTIAYKDGYIACDSRLCQGGTIADDSFVKLTKRNGVKFFISGNPHSEHLLIEAYFDENRRFGVRGCNCVAFIVDGDDLFQAGVEGEAFWHIPIKKDFWYSIGSGDLHAVTAMDMGASAFHAVKMAARRDIYTGGKVRKYKVF